MDNSNRFSVLHVSLLCLLFLDSSHQFLRCGHEKKMSLFPGAMDDYRPVTLCAYVPIMAGPATGPGALLDPTRLGNVCPGWTDGLGRGTHGMWCYYGRQLAWHLSCSLQCGGWWICASLCLCIFLLLPSYKDSNNKIAGRLACQWDVCCLSYVSQVPDGLCRFNKKEREREKRCYILLESGLLDSLWNHWIQAAVSGLPTTHSHSFRGRTRPMACGTPSWISLKTSKNLWGRPQIPCTTTDRQMAHLSLLLTLKTGGGPPHHHHWFGSRGELGCDAEDTACCRGIIIIIIIIYIQEGYLTGGDCWPHPNYLHWRREEPSRCYCLPLTVTAGHGWGLLLCVNSVKAKHHLTLRLFEEDCQGDGGWSCLTEWRKQTLICVVVTYHMVLHTWSSWWWVNFFKWLMSVKRRVEANKTGGSFIGQRWVLLSLGGRWRSCLCTAPVYLTGGRQTPLLHF